MHSEGKRVRARALLAPSLRASSHPLARPHGLRANAGRHRPSFSVYGQPCKMANTLQAEGLCLRFPENLPPHANLTHEVAVQMLGRAVSLATQVAFQASYIDKPPASTCSLTTDAAATATRQRATHTQRAKIPDLIIAQFPFSLDLTFSF